LLDKLSLFNKLQLKWFIILTYDDFLFFAGKVSLHPRIYYIFLFYMYFYF